MKYPGLLTIQEDSTKLVTVSIENKEDFDAAVALDKSEELFIETHKSQLDAIGFFDDKKGGPGSGNFGHAGRPGSVGGSGSGKGIPIVGVEAAGFTDAALVEFTGYVARLHKEQPDLQIDEIRFETLYSIDGKDDQIIARVKGNSILVNPVIVKGDLSIANAYSVEMSSRGWVKHDNMYDVLTHESGHIKFPPDKVELFSYRVEAVTAFAKYAGIAKYDEGKWWKYQSDEFQSKVASDFSKYAVSCMGEFLAEGHLYLKKGTLTGDAKTLMTTLSNISL